jgi:hypothetical protein
MRGKGKSLDSEELYRTCAFRYLRRQRENVVGPTPVCSFLFSDLQNADLCVTRSRFEPN